MCEVVGVALYCSSCATALLSVLYCCAPPPQLLSLGAFASLAQDSPTLNEQTHLDHKHGGGVEQGMPTTRGLTLSEVHNIQPWMRP